MPDILGGNLMKIMKSLPVMVIGLAVVAFVGSACSKSSSGSGASQSQAVGQVMNLATGVAGVRAAGVVQPRISASVNCPSGGTLTVSESGMTSGIVGNTVTIGGSVGATFSSCVDSGYTFGGSWTEAFDFSATLFAEYHQPHVDDGERDRLSRKRVQPGHHHGEQHELPSVHDPHATRHLQPQQRRLLGLGRIHRLRLELAGSGTINF